MQAQATGLRSPSLSVLAFIPYVYYSGPARRTILLLYFLSFLFPFRSFSNVLLFNGGNYWSLILEDYVN